MKQKKAVILAVVIMLAAASILIAVLYRKPGQTSASSKSITIEVIHKDGSQATFSFQSDKKTLEEVMAEEDLVKGEESQYGLFVTEVDGEKSSFDQDGSWWKLEINGKEAVTGIRDTLLEDGSIYTWRYAR